MRIMNQSYKKSRRKIYIYINISFYKCAFLLWGLLFLYLRLCFVSNFYQVTWGHGDMATWRHWGCCWVLWCGCVPPGPEGRAEGRWGTAGSAGRRGDFESCVVKKQTEELGLWRKGGFVWDVKRSCLRVWTGWLAEGQMNTPTLRNYTHFKTLSQRSHTRAHTHRIQHHTRAEQLLSENTGRHKEQR